MVKVFNKKNDNKLFEAKTMNEVEKMLKKHGLPIVDVDVSELDGSLLVYTELKRKPIGEHYILRSPKGNLRRFCESGESLYEVSMITGRTGRGTGNTCFSDWDSVEERGWELVDSIPEDLYINGRFGVSEYTIECAKNDYPYVF